MSEELNVTTLRANLHKCRADGNGVGRRASELYGERLAICADELDAEPKPPLAVALDGAYVHAAGNEEGKERWFEVVVGKSIIAPGEASTLASCSIMMRSPSGGCTKPCDRKGWNWVSP